MLQSHYSNDQGKNYHHNNNLYNLEQNPACIEFSLNINVTLQPTLKSLK